MKIFVRPIDDVMFGEMVLLLPDDIAHIVIKANVLIVDLPGRIIRYIIERVVLAIPARDSNPLQSIG